MEYVDPSKSTFDSCVQAIIDVLTQSYPALNTKAGAVVRELVVRPMAYIYAWITGNDEAMAKATSMETLKASQATDNEVADEVAANYFVTRRSGIRSSGSVTIVTTSSTMQLPQNSAFDAEGVTLLTDKTIIAIDDTSNETIGNIQYVPIIPFNTADGTYMLIVPVVAADLGRIEVKTGTPVTPSFSSTSIVTAYVTSSVTGGRDSETDAQMMERAQYNTANAGIGSFYGIQKKLDAAPIHVFGFGLVAGEDDAIYRARYNSVNINPGTYVDCHIKTQTQPAIGEAIFNIDYETAKTEHTIDVQLSQYAGAYSVYTIYANGDTINSYIVTPMSSDNFSTADGARLGVDQILRIGFSTDTAVTSLQVRVLLKYMPGVNDVQNYMLRNGNRFVGQNLKVKAAVPISLTLDCWLGHTVDATPDIITKVKQTIADTVNALPVGTQVLNFSDIADAVTATVPGVNLRLPCTIGATVPRKDNKEDTYYSVAGVLDIGSPVSDMTWPVAVCYFSLTESNIRLVVE